MIYTKQRNKNISIVLKVKHLALNFIDEMILSIFKRYRWILSFIEACLQRTNEFRNELDRRSQEAVKLEKAA